MDQAKAAKYLPAILVASFSWMAGGTLWYVCVTQSMCTTVADADTQTSTQIEPETTTTAQPTTTVQTQEPTTAEVETEPEPVVPAFDTTQTVTVLFNPDSATFRDRTWQNDLNEFITYLKANRSETVTISGYIAFGTPSQSPDSISIRRATAVAGYMIENGVTQSQIKTIARTGAVGDTSTEAGRIQNRRAVVSFD